MSVLQASRADMQEGEQYIARACRKLREGGFPETADDIAKLLKLLHSYSRPQTGLLAQLEAAPDWPGDWPEGTPMRSIMDVKP